MATKRSARRPNPQALAALHDRLIWYLAKREIEKRAKAPKRSPARSFKV